jgi:hypothetical protein
MVRLGKDLLLGQDILVATDNLQKGDKDHDSQITPIAL